MPEMMEEVSPFSSPVDPKGPGGGEVSHILDIFRLSNRPLCGA